MSHPPQRTVSVTGAAGFIGSHLCDALYHEGYSVRALDNLSLGAIRNLESIPRDERFQFQRLDIADVTALESVFHGCSIVFHLAASPSVPRSIHHPVPSHQDNLTGALNVLEAARRAGVQRVLFASSSAIYGENPIEPKSEDFVAHPITPYGLQKYAAEEYCRMFTEFHDLDTVRLRYFNVFGPRQAYDSPYSGVIAKFCEAAIRKRRPVIFGDGSQTRDFTYVSNVIAANIAAANAKPEAVRGKVFNVATGSSISLLDLIDELSALSGFQLEPEFQAPRPGDIRRSQADTHRAEEAFGMEIHTSWREGLQKTFESYVDSMAFTGDAA